MKKVDIVTVDEKYCDYLRKYDKLVPFNYDRKRNRPFVGVLFEVNNCKYFAPLSSPKKKHYNMKNNLDFYKLENKYYDKKSKETKYQLIGVINFNNMIPLIKGTYNKIDLNQKVTNEKERKYMDLLKLDFIAISDNINDISKKAKKLYNLYINNKLSIKLHSRCCNFLILETKSKEYI